MYNYYYLMEYLPKRYNASVEEEQNREICYNFKDGFLSDGVKQSFLDKIKEITGNTTHGWIICFIPASSASKTRIRFAKLAQAISEAGYNVDQNAIFNRYDKESGHLTGKSGNPIEAFGFDKSKFANKNVILIDDIITRGTTFNLSADKMKLLGAKSVIGLFLAKTVNPDYTPGYIDDSEDYEQDYYDPCDYEEETYERYNGSYAQDVEGWSDQDIDDVFDGDPDAYWNID